MCFEEVKSQDNAYPLLPGNILVRLIKMQTANSPALKLKILQIKAVRIIYYYLAFSLRNARCRDNE